MTDIYQQFATNAEIVSRIANGDASTVVQTTGGPVRSLAKLVADNQTIFNNLTANYAPKLNPDFTGTALFVNATYSGLITPDPIKGIKGSGDATTVQVGSIGEKLDSGMSASAALLAATPKNITQLVLTPGIWNVHGFFNLVGVGGNLTNTLAGINTVSATLGAIGTSSQINNATGAFMGPTPVQEIKVAVGTTKTIYLVGFASTVASTATCQGQIQAFRRA